MTQPTVPYLLSSVDLSCHLKQVKQTFSDLENNLTLYDSNDFKNHTNQKEYYIYLFNKLVECEYLNLRLCRLYQSQYLPQKNETYFQTSMLKSTIRVRETTTSVNSDSFSTDTMKAEWTSESVSKKNDNENFLNLSFENLKDIEIFNKEFHNLWKKLKCFREQLGKHINLLEKDSILTPFQLERLLHRVRRMHLINVEWLVQLNLQHLSKYDNLILFMKYVMELTHTSTPEDCINALSKLFKPSLRKPFKLFQSQTTTVCPSLKMTHKWTKVTTLVNISQASTQSFKNNETIRPIMDSKRSQDTSSHRSELNNNDMNVNSIEMERLCVTDKKSDCSSSEKAFSTECTTQKPTCFTIPTCHKNDHFQPVDKAVLLQENINATDSVLSSTKFHQLTFTEMLSFQDNDSLSLQVDIKKNACSTRNSQCTPLCRVSKSITDCDNAFHKHIHEDISPKLSEKCIIQRKFDISNSRNHNMTARTNKTLDHFNDNISKPSFVTSSSITDENTSSLYTKKNETQILWTRNLKNMNDEEQDIFKDLMKSQTVWEKKLSFNKKDCDFHSNWMKTALLQNFTNDECAFPELPRTLTKSYNKNNKLIHSQQLKTSISNNTQEMYSNHTGKPCNTRITSVKDPSNFSSDNKNKNIHLSLKNIYDDPNIRLNHSVITNQQYRKHNHSACQKTIHNYRLMYRSLIHETYDKCLNENMKLFSLWIGLSLKEEYDILSFSTSIMKKPMTYEILEAYVASNLLFAQPLSSTIPSCRLWKIFDSFFCTRNNLASKKYEVEMNSLSENHSGFI